MGSLAETGMGGLQYSNARPFKVLELQFVPTRRDDRRRQFVWNTIDPPGGHAMNVYISFIHRSPVK